MRTRIVGYDCARAIAIFVMVVENYKTVMVTNGGSPEWLVRLTALLDGRSAPLFVMLAGVGISLHSQSGRVSRDKTMLTHAQIRILKRALFFFIFGLLNMLIWPADMSTPSSHNCSLIRGWVTWQP